MDLFKIARSIKSELERDICRIHSKHPDIKISGSKDPKFEITGCCDAFVHKIRDKAMEKLNIETKKAVEEDLKNMFKGFGS